MTVELAYIQHKSNGDLLSEVSSTMWEGCDWLGLDRVAFVPKREEGDTGLPTLDDLELSPETLVSGGVGTVRRALEKLGVPEPPLYGIPPEPLTPFLGRKMWATTMGEVREYLDRDEPLFVKPLKAHKAFTGLVTGPEFGKLARIAPFPDNFEVAVSEVAYFDVEYRLFVHDRRGTRNWKIIDCRYYRGDFRKSLDWDVVDQCISAWHDAPIAYSLDMGVTAQGKTCVVEVNDCMSLGTYGIPPEPYARMVIDRWEQVVESKS